MFTLSDGLLLNTGMVYRCRMYPFTISACVALSDKKMAVGVVWLYRLERV